MFVPCPTGKPKTPVILVCGFLGAGKTTLLTHISVHNDSLILGLIRNEYQQTQNVDYETPILVEEGGGGVEFVELPNRCKGEWGGWMLLVRSMLYSEVEFDANNPTDDRNSEDTSFGYGSGGTFGTYGSHETGRGIHIE